MTKLTIELVPKSSWYTGVRKNVTEEFWNLMRKDVYKKANYRCEICGGVGRKHPVECHEYWQYDDKNKMQKLDKMIALCPMCHSVKHIDLSRMYGGLYLSIIHLSHVNSWSRQIAKEYVEQQFIIWRERSEYEWKINIDALNEFSYIINKNMVVSNSGDF